MQSERKCGVRRRVVLAGVALVGLASSQAMAEPATEQGAKAIRDEITRYFGPKVFEKGILTIKPNGDGYDLTYDVSSSKLGLPADGAQFSFGPFTGHVKPEADGKYVFEQTTPSLDFTYKSGKAGPQSELVQRLKNCTGKGVFDLKAVQFADQSMSCESAVFTMRSPIEDIDASLGKIDFALIGKVGEAGKSDLNMTGDLLDLVETVTVKDPANPAPPMVLRADRIHETFAANGFSSQQFMQALAYFAARKAGDNGKAAQEQARAKLKAMLPLWKTLAAQIRYDNLTVGTPKGIIKIATVDTNLASNGLVKTGNVGLNLAMNGLVLPDGMVPDWAKAVVPDKATLDINLTGLDLETIAGKAIEVGTDAKPAQPGALQAALMPLLLAGQPKLAFDQTLTAPAYDVKGKGESSLLPAQQGKATVSASNLDEIAAALGKAGAAGPGPQRAAMGIAFLKGLAKTEADGRLTWDIDFDSLARKVTVNGQSFGPGAQK
ncbi:hypothetical protein [Labrys okinawensis]|nr:hypothetical protein [Labrys okinawensis]